MIHWKSFQKVQESLNSTLGGSGEKDGWRMHKIQTLKTDVADTIHCLYNSHGYRIPWTESWFCTTSICPPQGMSTYDSDGPQVSLRLGSGQWHKRENLEIFQKKRLYAHKQGREAPSLPFFSFCSRCKSDYNALSCRVTFDLDNKSQHTGEGGEDCIRTPFQGCFIRLGVSSRPALGL